MSSPYFTSFFSSEGKGSPILNPLPTGTATYPMTTFASFPPAVQPTLYPATSSPTYSSIGSFYTSSAAGTDRDPSLPPSTSSFPSTTGTYPLPGGRLSTTSSSVEALPFFPSVGQASPIYTSMRTSSPLRMPLTPTSSPDKKSSPTEPIRGLLSPTGSPTRSQGSLSGREEKNPEKKIVTEERDISEWGISTEEFDPEILKRYGNRFLLIYPRGQDRYGSLWARGDLLRGIQMLNTARVASISTIIESPIIEKYPLTLVDSPRDPGVVDDAIVAAISSLDEISTMKYVEMGKSSPNLTDLISYLKIARLIGDDDFSARLSDEYYVIANMEGSTRDVEMKNIGKKLEKGVGVGREAVSRVVGEKVAIPDRYILPYTRETREDFMNTFRDAVRAFPIEVGTFRNDRGIDYKGLIEGMRDLGFEMNYSLELGTSGYHPRLLKTWEMWDTLSLPSLIASLQSLSLLEAKDLLSLPLKDVDLTAPYIFNINEASDLTKAGFWESGADKFTPRIGELVEKMATFLHINPAKISTPFDQRKEFFNKFPLKNCAFTGRALGALYSISTRVGGDISAILEGDSPSYYMIPSTSDMSEERAAFLLPTMDASDGVTTINGNPYVVLRSSKSRETLFLGYTWGAPIHIVHLSEDESVRLKEEGKDSSIWKSPSSIRSPEKKTDRLSSSSKEFHSLAREQITYISSLIPSTLFSLDEENSVYYIWDKDHFHRPWLIYRGTLSSIFRSSSPNERIAITKDEKGDFGGYVSASLLCNVLTTSEPQTWYYNPRPGVDRPELYEPIPQLQKISMNMIVDVIEPGADLIRRMYGGRPYILYNLVASPFYLPLSSSTLEEILSHEISFVLYEDLFPSGFPSSSSGSSESSYRKREISTSPIEIENVQIFVSALSEPIPRTVKRIPIQSSPMIEEAPSVARPQSPPFLSLGDAPTTSFPPVSSTSQFPPVPTGFTAAPRRQY